MWHYLHDMFQGMDYSATFTNHHTTNDDLDTFTELFAMSDDPLNVTSPTMEMPNGNVASAEHSATSETVQPAYDLNKLDNATLEQLISSVCSLCSGDSTVISFLILGKLFLELASYLLRFILFSSFPGLDHDILFLC